MQVSNMAKSAVSGVSTLPVAQFISFLRYSDHTAWDIRLWECHIQWGDGRFGFGL